MSRRPGQVNYMLLNQPYGTKPQRNASSNPHTGNPVKAGALHNPWHSEQGKRSWKVPSPAAQHRLRRPAGSSGFTQSCWSSDLGQQKQQKENENKNSGLQHKTHSPLTSFHAFKIKPGCRLISLGFHDSVSFLHTRPGTALAPD